MAAQMDDEKPAAAPAAAPATAGHPGESPAMPYFRTLGKMFHDEAYRVLLWGLLCGLILMGLGLLMKHSVSPLEAVSLSSELLIHLGTGAVVAAFAVIFFDTFLHKNMIGKPLDHIDKEIEKAETAIARINETITLANVAIGGIGETISSASQNIVHLTSNVETAARQVEELSNIFGYSELRKKILEAYRNADQRIISVSDYWPIDDAWWEKRLQDPSEGWWRGSDTWENCELYSSLAGSTPSEGITFVGTMPWPDYNKSTSFVLEPFDFERLLGLVWRLNVAHCLRNREQELERRTEKIRVVIANIPVKATIANNMVFVILPRDERSINSRGTQLTGLQTGEEYTVEVRDREQGIADAYADLVLTYVRQARSSREYINSILCLAEMVNDSIDKNQRVSTNLEKCLDTLGMKEWLSSMHGHEPHERKKTAIGIFEAFLEFYPARTLNISQNSLTFFDLRRELL